MKIEVKNVEKIFKNNVILKNINITFDEGKIYGLIGRNGSGKSVFLKMLCSFYEPTSGEILYDGVNIIKEQKFPPSTLALIEKPMFIDELTGFDNLKLLAKIQNKIGDKEILEALEVVNLLKDKDKVVKNYSLGMKQKLGIAQVIMENPKVIILDEPFNGIEEASVVKIKDYLKTIKENTIIIISTHIREDLLDLSDVIYQFDAGSVRCLNEEIIKWV